ncbi:MAG: hypothetical protein M1484_03565 [Patescibacteria group bacterium]|nr:hypothetical protein [Patescibacteria group bacterium]MCL5432140.1 hypothetical protein [Patescibacteria group bacterium]
MKKLIKVIIFITVIAFITRPALAVDATPSGNSDILDQLASKAAQLTQGFRRVYTGEIKSVGTTSYTVTTNSGDKLVTTNDATSFFRYRANKHTEINFSALKNGDDLAAIGTIDPQTGEMTAKQIIAKVHRYNIVGLVQSRTDMVFTIKETSGKISKVDLSGLTTNPASIKNGDFIGVIAYVSDPNSDTLTSLRVVDFTK